VGIAIEQEFSLSTAQVPLLVKLNAQFPVTPGMMFRWQLSETPDRRRTGGSTFFPNDPSITVVSGWFDNV
jgi:hypothetical protein